MTTATRPALHAPLCDLLGIRYPICQAGMAWETRQGEILPFPIQAQRVGFPASVRAREEGDVENGHAACGQSAGLIHEIVPARAVIEGMIARAEETIRALGGRT